MSPGGVDRFTSKRRGDGCRDTRKYLKSYIGRFNFAQADKATYSQDKKGTFQKCKCQTILPCDTFPYTYTCAILFDICEPRSQLQAMLHTHASKDVRRPPESRSCFVATKRKGTSRIFLSGTSTGIWTLLRERGRGVDAAMLQTLKHDYVNYLTSVTISNS